MRGGRDERRVCFHNHFSRGREEGGWVANNLLLVVLIILVCLFVCHVMRPMISQEKTGGSRGSKYIYKSFAQHQAHCPILPNNNNTYLGIVQQHVMISFLFFFLSNKLTKKKFSIEVGLVLSCAGWQDSRQGKA